MQKKTLFSFLVLLIILNSCLKETSTNPDPNTPFVWVVGKQTILKSTDAGNTWKNYADENETKYLRISKENIILRSVSFSNSAYGIITGDDSLVYNTIDAVSWSPEKIDKRMLSIYSSVKFDSALAYICGKNGYLASTETDFTNPMVAKIKNFISGVTYDLHGIDFINPTTGWSVGDSSTVLFTNDKGITWTKQITATGNCYNAVCIHKVSSSLNEVWIVGKKGKIFKTTDNGLNWISVASGTTEDLTAISFAGSTTAYLSGSNGLILKTTDNGASFQKLNTGTTETLNSISFMDENYGIAAGNKGVLIKSDDSGNTWSQMSIGIAKDLYCVYFVKRFKK